MLIKPLKIVRMENEFEYFEWNCFTLGQHLNYIFTLSVRGVACQLEVSHKWRDIGYHLKENFDYYFIFFFWFSFLFFKFEAVNKIGKSWKCILIWQSRFIICICWLVKNSCCLRSTSNVDKSSGTQIHKRIGFSEKSDICRSGVMVCSQLVSSTQNQFQENLLKSQL